MQLQAKTINQVQPTPGGDVGTAKNQIQNQEKDVEGFWPNIAKMLKCGYLPTGGRTAIDKTTFWSVILNLALLSLYTILTSLIFSPWWVGYTIGSWIMIAQLSLIIFIKYYQMYYNVSFQLLIIDR